ENNKKKKKKKKGKKNKKKIQKLLLEWVTRLTSGFDICSISVFGLFIFLPL
ncbi:unnamed protein product, partial [marine sediment metagenome]